MKNRYAGIDEFIITVIAKEVSKLEGRYGIGPDDLEDLQQELHLQVWRKLSGKVGPDHPQFRPAVRRTVDRRIKDLIEYLDAGKRRGEREALRLDQAVGDGEDEDASFGDLQDLEAARETYGGDPPAWHRHREARIDLDEALARLPADLRRLADAIEALDGNLSAVERELGLTRKKVRCDLAKLRAALRHLEED